MKQIKTPNNFGAGTVLRRIILSWKPTWKKKYMQTIKKLQKENESIFPQVNKFQMEQ